MPTGPDAGFEEFVQLFDACEQDVDTWWCGTNLDYGVLAVLMAQDGSVDYLKAQTVGSDMVCGWLPLAASRTNGAGECGLFLVRRSWGATWSELGVLLAAVR